MGYRFKPWTDEESLGRGDRILDYLRETAREYDVDAHIRYDHRVVRASWDSAAARWTVEAEHAGRDRHDHRGLPLELPRLLRLRARSRAGLRRRGRVPRPDRPPAALAGRPGVGRPERRGHRQRRDRGDAGPGHGGRRGARDDAAALAVVRPEPGRPRPRRPRPAQAAPPAPGLSADPLEEHPHHLGLLPDLAPAAAAGEAARPQAERRPAPRGLRRRHPLRSELRPLGPADVLRAGRRPLQGAPQRARGGGDVDHRPLRRDRHRADRRPPPRGRPRRHRDRSAALALRWHRAGRRRRPRSTRRRR